MQTHRCLQFISQYSYRKWYQPVIFEPGVLEIRGSWDKATKSLAQKILCDVKNKSILDVGCNTGFFLQEAFHRGATRLVGIDNDPDIIKLAIEITGIMDIGPLEFQHVPAINYSPPQTFDIVLMLNVLDFTDNPTSCIQKYLDKSRKLIIEHELKHLNLFPQSPNHQDYSKRAAGRILSIFNV